MPVDALPQQRRRLKFFSTLTVPANGSGRWNQVRTNEFIRGAVEAVAARFGRIVLMASLLDHETGQYSIPLLGLISGTAQANRMMREIHRELLLEWLNLSLEDRVEDMALYFRCLGSQSKTAARHFICARAYADLLPLHTEQMHRAHFVEEVDRCLPLAYTKL